MIKSFRPDFEEYVARLNPEDADADAVAARLLNDLSPTDAAVLRTLRTPSQIAPLAREAVPSPGWMTVPAPSSFVAAEVLGPC